MTSKTLQRMIHVGCKQLGLDNDTRHDLQLVATGKASMSTHVGIVIRHGLMIHMEAEDCAKLADYRGGAWGNRLQGHYRHVERPVQLISQVPR